MSRTTPSLEDRLVRYRPTLDDAIADRTALAPSDHRVADLDLIDLDWPPAELGRSAYRSRVLVGASAVVLIGGLAVVLATRDNPPVAPAHSAATPDTSFVSGNTTSAEVVDTTPATTIEGSGVTPACPPETETVTHDTIYLGGPASAQNLAAPGFIFSVPIGPTAVDIAIRAIALPVIGQQCSIVAAPTSNAGTVMVTVNPPAVPTALRLEMSIVERDGIIGVTGITGSTRFATNRVGDQVNLTLIDGLPASAARVQVRFKKGNDVWELTADATTGTAITLAIPSGEADRFPDQPIDWALFTAIDANDHVVDVGGGLI